MTIATPWYATGMTAQQFIDGWTAELARLLDRLAASLQGGRCDPVVKARAIKLIAILAMLERARPTGNLAHEQVR